MKVELKLTPNEWAIVDHRLSLPDALADCLSDGEEAKYQWQQVCDAANNMRRDGKLVMVLEVPSVEADILQDCVDGSTYFASAEDAVACGQISRGKLMADQKSAYSLHAKLTAIGIECDEFPMR